MYEPCRFIYRYFADCKNDDGYIPLTINGSTYYFIQNGRTTTFYTKNGSSYTQITDNFTNSFSYELFPVGGLSFNKNQNCCVYFNTGISKNTPNQNFTIYIKDKYGLSQTYTASSNPTEKATLAKPKIEFIPNNIENTIKIIKNSKLTNETTITSPITVHYKTTDTQGSFTGESETLYLPPGDTLIETWQVSTLFNQSETYSTTYNSNCEIYYDFNNSTQPDYEKSHWGTFENPVNNLQRAMDIIIKRPNQLNWKIYLMSNVTYTEDSSSTLIDLSDGNNSTTQNITILPFPMDQDPQNIKRTIDAGEHSNLFRISRSNLTVTFKNLIIKNSKSTRLGAITVTKAKKIIIDNCEILNNTITNTSNSHGAGICLSNSGAELVVTSSIIKNR